MKRRLIAALTVTVISAIAIRGGFVAFKGRAGGAHYEGNDPSIPTLDIYTSTGVTTPHIGFFSALKNGELKGLFNFRIMVWKNPDDLLSLVMAGKGDLWVGHTDGFAAAKFRGAPVSMLLFSSFRKFYIVSSEDIRDISDLGGKRVAYAPHGSPAYGMMKAATGKKNIRVDFEPFQGRELMALMHSGRVTTAILPEPLVTMLISKNRKFKVSLSVEELFLSTEGREGYLPVAGIAVNSVTAGKFPERIGRLRDIIVRRSREVAKEGGDAAASLPEYLRGDIPPDVMSRSLERDFVYAFSAEDLSGELFLYLGTAGGNMFDDKNIKALYGDFIWRH